MNDLKEILSNINKKATNMTDSVVLELVLENGDLEIKDYNVKQKNNYKLFANVDNVTELVKLTQYLEKCFREFVLSNIKIKDTYDITILINIDNKKYYPTVVNRKTNEASLVITNLVLKEILK